MIGYQIPRFGQTGSNFGAALGTRDTFPVFRRRRHDGVRRCGAGQRRFLEHVFPDVVGDNRIAQLPRQCHHLSRRRESRRQLPGRHEDPDPDRRTGPRRTSDCSAHRCFEIPRSTQRDSRLDLSRSRVPTPPPRQEHAQHRHHGHLPARPMAAHLHPAADRGLRRRPGRQDRHAGDSPAGILLRRLQLRLLGVDGAARDRVQGAPTAVLLHLPALLLVARALLEAQHPTEDL